LTIHDTQEWYDLYSDKRNEEFNLFFDRYLKGSDNGLEKTPRVRVSLLGYNMVSDQSPDLLSKALTDLSSPTSPTNKSQIGRTHKLNTSHSS
jgi:hypothetical protein